MTDIEQEARAEAVKRAQSDTLGTGRITTFADVKARKRHQCEVCGWPIEPGETYERAVTFDAGSVGVWKSHLTPCAVATDRAWLDGYDDGGLIDADAVAEWAEEREDEDEHAAELNRRLRINHERWRERRMKDLEVVPDDRAARMTTISLDDHTKTERETE